MCMASPSHVGPHRGPTPRYAGEGAGPDGAPASATLRERCNRLAVNVWLHRGRFGGA